MTLKSAGLHTGTGDTGERWEADISWLTDHLAVSGCFPIELVGVLADRHRIRAVVDLREEDRDNEEKLSSAGINFLHLPTPDLAPAPPDVLDSGVRFVRDHVEQRQRVLIHCQHGIGRSPLLALCAMVDLGFEPLEALRQAKDRRMCVSPSASQYHGWVAWLERHGHSAPDYHSFGCIAYRHLAQG